MLPKPLPPFCIHHWTDILNSAWYIRWSGNELENRLLIMRVKWFKKYYDMRIHLFLNAFRTIMYMLVSFLLDSLVAHMRVLLLGAVCIHHDFLIYPCVRHGMGYFTRQIEVLSLLGPCNLLEVNAASMHKSRSRWCSRNLKVVQLKIQKLIYIVIKLQEKVKLDLSNFHV